MSFETSKAKRKTAPTPPVSPGDVLSALMRWLFVMPALGAYRVTRWGAVQMWRVFRWSMNQAWHITQWGAGLAWAGIKLPFRFIVWLFGFGTPPDFENVYQREAWFRVKRYYRRRLYRNLHTLAFAGSAAVFILQTLYHIMQSVPTNSPFYFNNFLMSGAMFMGFWLIILIAHFAYVRSRDNEAVALQNALEQYRGYQPPRKAKDYEEIDEYYPPQRSDDDYAHLDIEHGYDEGERYEEMPQPARRRRSDG